MERSKTFALDVRVVVCKQCGAPLNAPALGGQVKCEYCDAVNQVAPRPELRLAAALAAPPVADAVAEQQRIASLHNQARAYNATSNPYAFFRAPAGLESVQAAVVSKGFRDAALAQQLQGRFASAVAECERSPGDPEAQRRCFWLARVMSQCWSAQDHFLHQRAVLEAALEVLRDPGHKAILECSLSSAARAMGDLASADAWLSQCDPRPALLDLDSSYRVTAATLALVREQWGKALGHVGPAEGQIPFEPASRLLARVIRAAALEGAGNAVGAEAELKAAASEHGRKDVRSLLEVNDAVARARQTFDRLDSRKEVPRGPARVGAFKVWGCLSTLLVLGLVGAIIAFYPVACTGCGSMLGWHQAAMERLRACPAAAQALGEPLRASYVGFSCGNFEVTNGSGYASWRLPVTGSRASGVYEFNATSSGGVWTVNSGTLTVDGRTIDLMSCSNAFAPGGFPMGVGGSSQTVVIPPGGVPFGGGGACDRMQACCQFVGADPSSLAICGSLPQLRSMGSTADAACGSMLNSLRERLQSQPGGAPPQCL